MQLAIILTIVIFLGFRYACKLLSSSSVYFDCNDENKTPFKLRIVGGGRLLSERKNERNDIREDKIKSQTPIKLLQKFCGYTFNEYTHLGKKL